MICEVWRLGHVPYADALALQDQLVEARGHEPSTPDRLLLLQHPHTYTLGTSAKDEHLLMPPDERERCGVSVYRVDRGGDITYHGPGQLIGYPIVGLNPYPPSPPLPHNEGGVRTSIKLNFVGYVRKLEQAIICTLADYGLPARPNPGLTGVWVDTAVGEAKIAAIGVKINVRAVTKHGFALNLNTDLRYFDGIVPCGIHDKGVTSLTALLGHPVDEDEAARRLVAHFGAVFEREMVYRQP
jgi:lipoyl(octanoyl) transferase